MAVYKVIQDVEAEDKLLGPLSFKGFIYAIIALACGYINFRLLLLGTPIKWVMLPIFLLPMALFGVLASPLGREQPTEVWLLSKIKFFIKPRKRLWDQDGLEELVTITAPKKNEQRLTKDISQSEVHSRLKTLASTLDTRGWAIKNVDTNLNISVPEAPGAALSSDRLVANAGYTQSAQVIDIHAADDILDEQNNPTAQKFASLMQDADEKRRKDVLQTMKGLIEDSSGALTENSLTKRLAKARADFRPKHSHKPTHKSKKSEPAAHKSEVDKKPEPVPKSTPVTPERQAVNMELAQSGSAFSVATLSQLANRQPKIEQTGPNEVTISLH
jgi:predicted outer membrane protein